MTHDEVFITLLFAIDIFIVALVIASASFLVHLNRRTTQMSLDFTGVQSSLSTLTTTVSAVSSEVSTLQAGSDTTADQATLDGVTSSLNGINSTLSNLVPVASTVSEIAQ